MCVCVCLKKNNLLSYHYLPESRVTMYNHAVQIKNVVYSAHIMLGIKIKILKNKKQIGLQKHVGVNEDQDINYT